jgi:hypothetical protein
LKSKLAAVRCCGRLARGAVFDGVFCAAAIMLLHLVAEISAKPNRRPESGALVVV